METQAHRRETQAAAKGPVCVEAGVSALKPLILLSEGLAFRAALGQGLPQRARALRAPGRLHAKLSSNA